MMSQSWSTTSGEARDAERLFRTEYADVLDTEERAGLLKLAILGLRVRFRALVQHRPVLAPRRAS